MLAHLSNKVKALPPFCHRLLDDAIEFISGWVWVLLWSLGKGRVRVAQLVRVWCATRSNLCFWGASAVKKHSGFQSLSMFHTQVRERTRVCNPDLSVSLPTSPDQTYRAERLVTYRNKIIGKTLKHNDEVSVWWRGWGCMQYTTVYPMEVANA